MILDEACQRALGLARRRPNEVVSDEELLLRVLDRGVELLERDGKLPPLPGPPSRALEKLNALRQEVLEAQAATRFLLQRTLRMIEEYERLEGSTDELAAENRRLRSEAWTARAAEERLTARLEGGTAEERAGRTR